MDRHGDTLETCAQKVIDDIKEDPLGNSYDEKNALLYFNAVKLLEIEGRKVYYEDINDGGSKVPSHRRTMFTERQLRYLVEHYKH